VFLDECVEFVLEVWVCVECEGVLIDLVGEGAVGRVALGYRTQTYLISSLIITLIAPTLRLSTVPSVVR
jgi:hypothetical protein